MLPPMPPLSRALLLASLLLGAGLSFVAEPLIGRLVVTRFGSAVHVWTVCVMVFQGLLLAGYAWAHFVAPRIGPWHLAVVALGAAQLPLAVTGAPDPEAPIATLVWRLVTQVALPFWALTTTSVVAQDWAARARSGAVGNPYPLYAASNVGSLLGLLAYPLLIEPLVGLQAQRAAWAVGFGLWWLALAGTWWVLRPAPPAAATPGLRADWAPNPRWILLAAAPSAGLLAVTQTVASEVGSFPMVWVIPLALYLASFIPAFRDGLSERWDRWAPDLALGTALLGAMPTRPALLIAFFACFFLACVATHGALYRARPEPARLTRFYLEVSVGGWLGGLLMSLGAPALLDRMLDLPLAAALWLGALALHPPSRDRAWWATAAAWQGGLRLGVAAAGVAVGLLGPAWLNQAGLVDRTRNFYGVFEVREQVSPAGEPYRLLSHGRTVHGVQYLSDEKPWPLSYYHQGGPLHEALDTRSRPARIGAVGLGIGAITWWLEAGEELVFYEIDPDNEPLARRWFRYLEPRAGRVSVRVGDARLLMETEADRSVYDVVFVDAFSGDAIPLHLLTREATRTWTSRLADDGLLIVHLSNRYYDLRGVLAAIADAEGLHAAWRIGAARPDVFDDPLASPMIAMVLTRDPARLDPLLARGWKRAGGGAPWPAPAWTDDHQNPLLPLWKGLSGFR